MKNNSKELVLEFNLPDFKEEDISVKILKNSAVIKAGKKIEKGVKRKGLFTRRKNLQGVLVMQPLCRR